MKKHTTPSQRREFYELHEQGLSYPEIAQQHDVSRECVRYWCRRQRDGGSCESSYQREPSGILGRFDARVRYRVLRFRLEHPKWGPRTIRYHLTKVLSLKGLRLPSRTQIGRYLHQWERFRRKPREPSEDTRPEPPTEVHQRWQVDFKVNIALQDGTIVDLHTVRDPFGEACIGAVLHSTQQVTIRTKRVTMQEVRTTLRRCFDFWNTLPDEVQTDGESTLVTSREDGFPSIFTLWLIGLGIKHLVIRRGKPTDNAEVERCHRTVNEYAVVGNERHPVLELQSILDDAVLEMAIDLTSRAEGCAGRTPAEAHPELFQPRRFFRADQELALFDLRRVDAFLSTFTWTRIANKSGQVCVGGQSQRYSVGRAYAHKQIWVRFDPSDRCFVFFRRASAHNALESKCLHEIKRLPARNLDVEHLTGLATWPASLVPQQLPLPLCFEEG
jgi:transposase InsO family protein